MIDRRDGDDRVRVSHEGRQAFTPFITLAAYDALTGSKATAADGAEYLEQLPRSVKRAAMSIETFHKASLVHDDIEDDDAYRYGAETMHRRYGIPTAINIGDYLIGLGYRLVSSETSELGAEKTADILNALAEAHLKLSEGQGAELIWRDASDKRLKPIDALKIYALKTSPAFEAALYSGIRLAQEVDEGYAKLIKGFSRNLGVAFQILNDLKDWQGDDDNKLAAGGDVIGGRPTVLWALALDGLDATEQAELLRVASPESELADQERICESDSCTKVRTCSRRRCASSRNTKSARKPSSTKRRLTTSAECCTTSSIPCSTAQKMKPMSLRQS